MLTQVLAQHSRVFLFLLRLAMACLVSPVASRLDRDSRSAVIVELKIKLIIPESIADVF